MTTITTTSTDDNDTRKARATSWRTYVRERRRLDVNARAARFFVNARVQRATTNTAKPHNTELRRVTVWWGSSQVLQPLPTPDLPHLPTTAFSQMNTRPLTGIGAWTPSRGARPRGPLERRSHRTKVKSACDNIAWLRQAGMQWLEANAQQQVWMG